MAKAFGKFKSLIKKGTPSRASKGNKAAEDKSPTPASTPTRDHDVLEPAADATQEGPVTTGTSNNDGGDKVIATADEVLEGILQDLNIKEGQLALDAGKADTVSEYSGGSAKSIESGSSDEDDDEDTDDDDEEETDEEQEGGAAGGNKSKKKRSSVGDRVAAVVAAAEEIRKKRNSPAPSNSRSSSPATEPGSAEPTPPPPAAVATQDSTGAAVVSMKKSGEAASVAQESTKQEETVASSPSKMARSRQSSKSPSKKSLKARASPITSMIDSKLKKRSTTPQFSPEIQTNDNNNAAGDDFPSEAAAAAVEEEREPEESPTDDTKSFEEDDRTKDTQEISEEGISFIDEEEDNTLGESTLGMSYDPADRRGGRHHHHRDANASLSDSQNEASTFDEEEEAVVGAKRTVMNKDIIIHEPGQPSNLVVRAMYYTPLPASPEDIIIKVEASTVSYRDCLLRRGIGMEKITFPFVPGCEVVGTISNVGKAARNEGYRIGDRVVGMSRRGGGNGYYAKFNTSNVAPVISTNIDAGELACLVDVYMTAYQALRVGKKDGTPLTEANVLITDGFSPVGQAAVQLAKLEGANVYVTTMESRQDEYMKTLGVKCLPLAPNKWLHKLKGKMDIVIDNTCFDSYDSSWKALNVNGILICTGMTSLYTLQDFHQGSGCGGCDAFGDIRDYQAKWAAIKARYMMSQTKFHDLRESFQKDPKKYNQELKYLCFLVESGQLKPKIAERVSIEEVPDAQRYLETGKANGTIVCLP